MTRKPVHYLNAALLASSALIAVPAHADHHAAPAAEASDAEMTEDQRLRALFAASDEDNLRRNPIMAIFRGDMRYANRIGDFITDEYFDAERAAAVANLAALAEIDREALSPTNRIAYDIFRLQEEENVRDVTPEMLALTVVRPVNHFSGFHGNRRNG
ncbi:MAG: hypothetical protein ACTS1X_03465 [Parasphingopyxis sp.]|uniref:hypothetical protein n=1 Tax=Parasphingopyxis sp. TaxID=1920299 RepID=UPI003FA1445F